LPLAAAARIAQMGRSVVRLAGERCCPHGGTTLKLIEPLREPGTPGAKVGQTAEFEPAQASRQRDVAHMNRGSDIQLALEPVITRDELFVVTVPKLGVAQRFRPANGLPAECNAGIRKTLSQGLLAQCLPPRFAFGGNQLAPLVQR